MRGLVAIAIAVLLVTTASTGVLSQTNPTPGPERVVDTGELMQLLIRPAYQELQRAVATPPQSRQDWSAIYLAAVRLAELENLIFIREPSRYTTQPAFANFAARARQSTVDVVTLTLMAMPYARSEDFDGVRRAYEQISASCTACHRGLGTLNGPTVKP